MLTSEQLMPLTILLAPIFSTLAILLVLILDVRHSPKSLWPVKGNVLAMMCCTVVNWGSLVFYFFYPEIFAIINAPVFFALSMVQVFFYGFIFHITRLDAGERFPRYHYYMPAILTLALLAVSFITPFEGQVEIIKAQGKCTNEDYRLFYMVSNSKIPVRTLYSVVYLSLSFYRLRNYRKRVRDYSANEEKGHLRWLSVYLILTTGLTPMPIFKLLLTERLSVINSSVMPAYYLLFTFQYAYLCYYVVKEKYVLMTDKEVNDSHESTAITPTATTDTDTPQLKKNQLTREVFDQFMATQRPYLNADLKITDLVAELNINRTYLSAFINSEYGVNFSSYINQCRLKEYERLQTLPEKQGYSPQELALMAGFGSYKSLLRFSKEHNIA